MMITLQVRSWDAALLWTLLEAAYECDEIRNSEQGYRLGEVLGNLTEAIVDEDGIPPNLKGSAHFNEHERLWIKLTDRLWPDKTEDKGNE